MRRLVWVIGLAVLGLWSVLAWGSHALLDGASGWAAANASRVSEVPEIVEAISRAFRSLGDASEIVVGIVWALGALLILGLAGVVSRLIGGRLPSQPHPRNRRI